MVNVEQRSLCFQPLLTLPQPTSEPGAVILTATRGNALRSYLKISREAPSQDSCIESL